MLSPRKKDLLPITEWVEDQSVQSSRRTTVEEYPRYRASAWGVF
jgi:hypothetical protein